MSLRVATTASAVSGHIRETAKKDSASAQLIMKSSAAAVLAAGSLCPGPMSSVRLRPDATYVQLGDVDVPGARCVRIVHISDTPQAKREDLYQLIPDGDVLVHSGGLEGSGSGSIGGGGGEDGAGSCGSVGSIGGNLLTQLLEQRQLRRLRDFLAAMPHRHKVLVPGSRDARLHRFASSRTAQELQRKLGPCHYLHNSSVTLEGVTFYGVPGHASSSSIPDGGSSSWRKVPDQVDVLVAHNPPWEQLAQEVFQRVRPKALLHGQASSSENGAQWRDGVLVSNGSLAKVPKPVVIDFYTSRPGGCSQEYSEVMEVTSRLKRAGQGSESTCTVL